VSRWKTLLVGLGTIAGFLVLLMATGIVGVRSRDPDLAKSSRARSDSVEDIAALGYFAITTKDPTRRGVIYKDDSKVDPDLLVLYCLLGWSPGLRQAPPTMPWREVRLVDASGEIVHRWNTDAFDDAGKGTFAARMLPDGSIIAGTPERGIARIDWNSNVIWKREGRFHHDVNYDEQGQIYALRSRKVAVEFRGESYDIKDHGIAVLDIDGQQLEEFWFSDVFANDSDFHQRLEVSKTRAKQRNEDRGTPGKRLFGDVFHANTIEPLARDPDGRWQDGDYLTSLRNMNTIAVISHTTHAVLWKWGPSVLEHQHSPTAAPDGRFLVFDNGIHRRTSRVLEVDPQTLQLTWEFASTTGDSWFSATRGVVQSLANDNVMVFSSNPARIFEVTRTGEIVWDFYAGEHYKNRVVPIRGQRLEGKLLETARVKLGLQVP